MLGSEWSVVCVDGVGGSSVCWGVGVIPCVEGGAVVCVRGCVWAVVCVVGMVSSVWEEQCLEEAQILAGNVRTFMTCIYMHCTCFMRII